MSVAVLLNLSDGLILGVDSAVTIFGASGISKVFEDSDKLFQLGSLPVGIATYGVAGLEGRTIGSFISEFEKRSDLASLSLRDVAEELRKFFLTVYIRFVETIYSLPFAGIAPEKKGTLGLIVGGFSPNAFLSEAWHVIIPWHDQSQSAVNVYAPGNFGTAWFATSDQIQRYITA